MTLSQKIAAALDAQVDSIAFPCELATENDTHRLTLSLTASSPVGVAFKALEFYVKNAAELSPEALRHWAVQLAARVTYLMEPLVVLEHDQSAGAVELRSQSPTGRGDLRTYYEVRLEKHGALKLSRVAFDETTRRRQPSICQMTREVLERLTDDLVACAN